MSGQAGEGMASKPHSGLEDDSTEEIIRPTFVDSPNSAPGSTQAEYIKEVEKATGNIYQVTIDPSSGDVIFTQTSQGPVTPEQQAFITAYGQVAYSPIVVNQDIVSNDSSTTVGSFTNNMMDMADVAQFDLAGPGAGSSAGAIIHETVEQYEKAIMGIAKGSIGTITSNAAGLISYPDFEKAHAAATQAENKVNGNIRAATANPYIDNFTEKNGTITRQAVIRSATSGTVQVMKKK